MKTAFNASKLAIAAFIVPFIFCFSPAMLLIGTTAPEVIQIVVTSFIGIFAVAAALEGYCFAKIPLLMRLLLAAGGLMLIYPGALTDLGGLELVAAILLILFFMGKKQQRQGEKNV